MFSKNNSFLTDEQKARIVATIREAEKNTSGEIRVHIEASCGNEHVLLRAQQVFRKLKMDLTAQRNAAILYIAYKDRKFAVYGDEGIHDKVGDSYWAETTNLLHDHFVKNEFEEGIKAAVFSIGEKLKVHFPYLNSDKNELSDEISEA